MDQTETLELWTVQAEVVLHTLETKGVYYVKKEYVQQKYGDTAWIFRTAYDFFVRVAAKKVPKPEQAEYPIWMYRDPQWPFRSSGAYLLRLAIPRGQVILFDLRDWSKVLNLSYLGSEEETQAFDRELQALSISAPSDVFQKPFYPVQRQKILKSWNRLLDRELPPETYIQGAAWQLKSEWITDKTLL